MDNTSPIRFYFGFMILIGSDAITFPNIFEYLIVSHFLVLSCS